MSIKRKILITGLVLLLLWGGLSLFFSIAKSQIKRDETLAFEEAKTKWLQNEPRHYKFIFAATQMITNEDCIQEIEVAKKEIVDIPYNTCKNLYDEPSKPEVISELFDTIEYFLDPNLCGPNGCRCDGALIPIVIYNDQFGYPEKFSVEFSMDERWRFPDYWRGLLNPFCHLVGTDYPEFRIPSFTVLP